MDHIKLIDAARRWLKPECRDEAEIDMDQVISPTGVGDAITEICELHGGLEGATLTLLISCESGIQIEVPL